jgi:hypothetical protein
LIIDLETLFPSGNLPSGPVTVMLVRNTPDAAGTHLQPLGTDDQPAMFTVEVGADSSTKVNFGVPTKDILGGDYVVLAVPQAVDSAQAFQDALQAGTPDTIGWQPFSIKNLVSLDQAGVALADNERQVDVPLTRDPAVLPETDIELQWRKGGNPLPQYTVLPQASEQGVANVYAPGQFIIDNFVAPVAPALAPQLTAQLGPYFTPGEYEIDVLIDGVLESTQTLVVP